MICSRLSRYKYNKYDFHAVVNWKTKLWTSLTRELHAKINFILSKKFRESDCIFSKYAILINHLQLILIKCKIRKIKGLGLHGVLLHTLKFLFSVAKEQISHLVKPYLWNDAPIYAFSSIISALNSDWKLKDQTDNVYKKSPPKNVRSSLWINHCMLSILH